MGVLAELAGDGPRCADGLLGELLCFGGSCWNTLSPFSRALTYRELNTLPMMATPSVPPSSRAVSLTAEPTPALPADSEPMIDSVAGAVVAPRPAPMRIIWPTMIVYGVSTPTLRAIHTNELASSRRPARTTAVVPTRSTIRVP